MILYFSGTGNSKYVAMRLKNELHDVTKNLLPMLKNRNNKVIYSWSPWIIVSPVYAWQLPHLIRDWLMETKLSGSTKVYFILTCGDDIGNAGKYLKRLCSEKGMDYCGCAPVVMPENYIAMYDAPDEEEARGIIKKADPVIIDIARKIENEEMLEYKSGLLDFFKSGIVNAAFYRLCIKSSCAGTTPENHQAALKTMRFCQIIVH